MKPRLSDAKASREYFEKKIAFTTGPVELSRWIKDREEILVVDVRAKEDYDRGLVPGSINLPKETWATPKGLAKDKINVLYCYSQTCHLAADAGAEFSAQGYPCMELEGGFEGWTGNKFPVEGGRKHAAPARSGAI